MLFIQEEVKTEEINSLANFFSNYENAGEAVEIEEESKENQVSKYLTSLAYGQYVKAVEDINNTVVGNRKVKRRSLQQVMKESFFGGANRFGTNFIA